MDRYHEIERRRDERLAHLEREVARAQQLAALEAGGHVPSHGLAWCLRSVCTALQARVRQVRRAARASTGEPSPTGEG